jgi:hypothetical protein
MSVQARCICRFGGRILLDVDREAAPPSPVEQTIFDAVGSLA